MALIQGQSVDSAVRNALPPRNLGDAERLVSGALGAVVALWAIRRGGLAGGLATLAGAAMIARGTSGYCPVTETLSAKPAERQIARKQGWRSAAAAASSVTIAKPVEDVYRFFRDVANLPRFMRHVESVTVIDETRSHWVVRAPLGRTVEWDATITEDRPNERIGWRSDAGAQVRNIGWIEFRPAPGGRGTEVRAAIAYEPLAGQLGRLVAQLWGEEPGKQAHDDLRRLKQVLETGEVPTPALRRADADAAMPDAA
ncbi:SRPBCC family protein [Roseomonas populi]|uniref:SRPBCC family protein n=1 Tax=Roseomonas populi TaxID=3121582 RepID=A0ABT1XC01_9PROT|nr:SRPBCC family protein [Roseomonas pecuniae]MCR0984933.1 SRPBCC family protein [Roseomonas pecuniae]